MFSTFNTLKFILLLFLLIQISCTSAVDAEKAQDDGSIWSAIRNKLAHPADTNTTVPEKSETLDTMVAQPEPQYLQEKIPSQMAPIEKAVLYLRPKSNERWVIKEEGSIIWAVSNILQSKADAIFMNCNLYQGDKMLLSVFKGVPLIVGTESWTPPVFLTPAPDYRLRLWSQPSEAGIIDEYSTEFSMVPRPDDAYMFSYNKSILMDNSNDTLPPDTRIRIGQYNMPTVNETEHPGIMLGVSDNVNATASFSDPNLPTGIYALYPSAAPCFILQRKLLIMAIVVEFIAVIVL